MSRFILTFETLFQVLAADKLLRNHVSCRPTPTPAGLTTAVCGVSLELLKPDEQQQAVSRLQEANMSPRGVHELP